MGNKTLLSRKKSLEIACAAWCLLALASLLPVTYLLKGSFPLFTVLWILVPLIAVVKTGDAGRLGFRSIPWREFARVSAINLSGLLIVALLFEPWSHTYQKLLEAVLASKTPDTTFAWLLRYPRMPALGGLLLYSGLVTLFGEELFFRGWLLQVLKKRMSSTWAITIQALCFLIPNLIASFLLPALQGLLYALVYTWLSIGMIGGWAASRTNSIWPSLFSATVANFVFVVLLV
jgi:membrane protease YdiL (CAAX protease family)